jgi:hypothetical protein
LNRLSTARDPFEDEPFLAALRSAGAHSRGDARQRADLPAVSDDLLAVFVATGVVRHAGDERYYAVVPPASMEPSARFTPLSVTLMTLAWAVVLLVPLIAWLVRR